jgi:hypothetical protein
MANNIFVSTMKIERTRYVLKSCRYLISPQALSMSILQSPRYGQAPVLIKEYQKYFYKTQTPQTPILYSNFKLKY